ncbi:MAG: PTS sugar transporter subunit IIA [Rhodospirillaceae bacterium]|nr:PTS sugar transporter subunit IIA [Rhodospirillaceae bacterium]
MSILDRLSAADVMLGVSAKNKHDLLAVMAAEAAGRLGRSAQEILDALEAREELGSTALGRGIALPHAELPDDSRPIMLFARLHHPIEFDARDAEPVDLVFLALWPAAATKGLLEALAEVCRALKDPKLLRRLRLAQTPADVIQSLRRL